MLAFRVAHVKYAGSLEASGADSRWTSGGRKVIYCAPEMALAFLENMVHRHGAGFGTNYALVTIQIPDSSVRSVIGEKDLPENWREFASYSRCQKFGNDWYDDRKTLLLEVPSAVLPQSTSLLIHCLHPDFNKAKITDIKPLLVDLRIDEMLKK